MWQQAVGEAGLRARAGTAGDAGSRTRRDGQAGDRRDLPVRAVVVLLTGAVLMADHHPGFRWADGLLSVGFKPRGVAALGPHVSGVVGSQVDSFLTESPQQINTFRPVVPVLLLPLVQQDVEVPRTLEEAQVSRRRLRREDSLELSVTTQLIFGLRQHADVLWSQDVQHRREEVLISVALCEVKGPFDLLIGRQIWLGLLPVSPQKTAGGAGGATAGRHHVFFLGDTEAGEVQEVSDHLTFDGNVQRRVGMKTWRYVDLQDPGFEFLIQHDVEAEQLVAAVRCPKVHLQQTVHVRL